MLKQYHNRQEYYRHQYRVLHPDWEDSMTIYRNLLDRFITPESRVCDIGCGHMDFFESVFSKTLYSYGIDPDEKALQKNTFLSHKVVGDVSHMPFEDNFFDVIASSWVLEHLEDPHKAFQEIYRVLKPSGFVISLTPNAWNYNTWIIRLIPNRFHEFFTRKLYHREEHDTYPVRYRINTPHTTEKICTSVGLQKVKIILNGDPTYISFNNFTFRLACMIESLHTKLFPRAKVHIISVFQKPE